MASSILWYDLETFGTHPQWDRIGQFAAIRTGPGFEQIGEAVNFYCRLSPDYLPEPAACLVSRMTPQLVNEQGLSERDFAAEIHRLMSEPGTCGAGFNTLRFDDEFIRALFYRNFIDPYKREYENRNTRWDIIDLARMARDLRPDGIIWPEDEEGKPVFRLQELAQANGLDTGDAHNALYDVKTTLALAKLLLERQEKLFKYLWRLRKKEEVRKLLNLADMNPILHTSGMFTSPCGCTTLVIPLSVHPAQSNVVLSYDLRRDPSDWVDLSPQEIRRRIFSRREELEAEERIPLKGIHMNRSPALAPLSTLDPDRAEALGIDLPKCLAHAEMLKAKDGLIQKIRTVYMDTPKSSPQDPELRIYSGDFFPDTDREVFEFIRMSPPEVLPKARQELHDPRGPELLWRYIARNYPESLSEEEKRRWKSFCASRLLTPEPAKALDFGSYMRDLRNRLTRIDTPAQDKKILKDLLDYGELLEKTVLS